MSICAIIYTLKQTHSYVLGLNPRLCIGFKLVWVEKIEGLVLVGLKMALNGYGSSMVLRDTCTGMVQVWFKYETILRFTHHHGLHEIRLFTSWPVALVLKFCLKTHMYRAGLMP